MFLVMIATINSIEEGARFPWENHGEFWVPSLARGDWHPAYYLVLGTEALEHCSSDACLRCGRNKRI